ncbi:hypothetical protein AAE045_18905 [Dryocola clanedunensis]
MAKPVSSVINAESFVVNRIPELTPSAEEIATLTGPGLTRHYIAKGYAWQTPLAKTSPFIAANGHKASLSEYSRQLFFAKGKQR